MTTNVPARVLPVIVFSQFAGTSLWFAANAVMPDLQLAWALAPSSVGTLTSAVQVGFVAGTLVFALLTIADRYRPTRLFLVCAAAGAVANAVAAFLPTGAWAALLASRFAVGFLLAGVYPIGMRIAASWYREGLGAAMGMLIGALVLGTALPYGLRAVGWGDGGGGPSLSWRGVLLGVSLLALAGGLATALLVPDAPRSAGAVQKINPRGLGAIWSDRRVRASVFGYFGHMWELYTFYVLVPFILATRLAASAVSATAFWVIASGVLGCVGGGLLARRMGSARVAGTQLALSGACGLAAPWLLHAPAPVFAAWLLLWGVTVVGDSPQFSTLTARNAPPQLVGSVLTFANCIGFGITVLSIELFVRGTRVLPLEVLLPGLAAGPAIGLWMLRPLLATDAEKPPRA
ncbi:Predicted arabinose efflux permease, MFS family [Variovorax sp. OK605]|uniref:MFS transporter n=1 Tax=Variovorax sp. OK605 TaxID=1855317 RepID=UPI0008F08CF1|nr:MFS transporter [Variovorax sp. OK605]SFQ22744.1 Predicted arabinose efflux permease, MFS family [Variovorax sp. OK605]